LGDDTWLTSTVLTDPNGLHRVETDGEDEPYETGSSLDAYRAAYEYAQTGIREAKEDSSGNRVLVQFVDMVTNTVLTEYSA
jgi:hypothetical protein